MGLDFLSKYAVDGRHYDQKTEIDKVLDNEDWSVRSNVIQHPNVTEEHIDKVLLGDVDWYVRYNAIQHPNATKENIDKALKDEHLSVRREASNIAKRNGWL